MAVKQRVRVFNGLFDPVTLGEAVDTLIELTRKGERGWVATINVAILMMMRSDELLQRFSEQAALSLADGQPLVWISRHLGTPLPERVTGIDLMVELCSRAEKEGLSVYLMGGAPGVARGAGRALNARFPDLIIAGTADGYFGKEEAVHRARAVCHSGAAILFVAMGVPRQERFIEQYWEALGATVILAVGGSFDVLAGRVPRAPFSLQRMGLEWAFRLAQEPGRLFKRYFVTNTAFIGLVCREFLFSSRARRPK